MGRMFVMWLKQLSDGKLKRGGVVIGVLVALACGLPIVLALVGLGTFVAGPLLLVEIIGIGVIGLGVGLMLLAGWRRKAGAP